MVCTAQFQTVASTSLDAAGRGAPPGFPPIRRRLAADPPHPSDLAGSPPHLASTASHQSAATNSPPCLPSIRPTPPPTAPRLAATPCRHRLPSIRHYQLASPPSIDLTPTPRARWVAATSVLHRFQLIHGHQELVKSSLTQADAPSCRSSRGFTTRRQSSETHDAAGQSYQTPRRTRSNVWEHFEQSLVQVDGDLKAACNLRGHIANPCPGIDDATRKRFQASMNRPLEANFVFDPQTCREAMNKFIIHAEIPFLKLEDPYLQPWINTMQPTFQVKGRQTIRSDCLKKYEDMKKELQTELQNLDSHVCLTLDIWTSSQNIGYRVVTAHYVDSEFKLKKKIIWFKELEYHHSGYAISDELVLCMTDWGIRDKLFTLTLDNASNNTSACELLINNHKNELLFEGEHLHVRCSAHILNILVQDVMKLIHSAIEKIRELLKHIDSSVSRLQAFNSIATGTGLKPKAVSSESAFSCGGRILGDHRSSLSRQMLEALICAKDWLFISKDLDVE
ncbi:hypothetical protein U9M48_004165, partial [Paspalum notatum var. saurae]